MIDNYNKLPVGKYLEIQGIVDDESLEEIDKQVKVISILADMDENEVMHLPIGEYSEMARQMKFLESADKNKHLVAKEYVLGGLVLIPTTDYRKVETCQYVDFRTFVTDIEKYFVELVSVFLVPKGCRYNEGYDVLDVHKAIREYMNVTDALSLSAFFLTLMSESIVDSLNYSREMAKGIKDKEKREEMMRMIDQTMTSLTNNGDGSVV